MAARLAWLLNLDADLELADPARHRPDATLRARMAELAARMTMLLRPEDLLLTDEPPREPVVALPFCPTPSALTRLAALGLRAHLDVPLEVLRRVNGRAFSAALGQTLPHAAYVRDLAELEALIQTPGAPEVFVLKRDHGFAGRERRQARGGQLDPSTRGFAQRSFARGEGLQVEPWLARSHDFARHGWVHANGALSLGPLVGQENDAMGRWERSFLLDESALTPAEWDALDGELVRAGNALYAAGYRGPFGIDAFRHRDPSGAVAFQPRSEINARFTMGFPRQLLDQALASE